MGRKHTDLDSRFDDIERKFEEKTSSGTWWVFEPVSRTLFGPEATEDEAYNKGLAKFPGIDFIVRDLHTVSKPEASSRIKGLQFADSNIPFKESIKRLKHK